MSTAQENAPDKHRHDDPLEWAREEPEAFASVFDRHHGRVYRHAQRLTDDVRDAEDVTAMAFFELWRKRSSVRVVDGSVLPWLLVTASNLARNARRSRRRYHALLAALPRPGTAPDPAEVALRRAPLKTLSPGLRSALLELPPRDLDLMVLVVLEGYSLSDAGEVLGISGAAARSRLHRARTAVRQRTDGAPSPDAPHEHARSSAERPTPRGAVR